LSKGNAMVLGELQRGFQVEKRANVIEVTRKGEKDSLKSLKGPWKAFLIQGLFLGKLGSYLEKRNVASILNWKKGYERGELTFIQVRRKRSKEKREARMLMVRRRKRKTQRALVRREGPKGKRGASAYVGETGVSETLSGGVVGGGGFGDG